MTAEINTTTPANSSTPAVEPVLLVPPNPSVSHSTVAEPSAVASTQVPSTSSAADCLVPIAPAPPGQPATSADDLAAHNNDNSMLDDSDEELISDQQGIERYIAAASTIGIQLQSSRASLLPVSGDPRQDFLLDHAQFMNDIDCPFKLRRIGGGELDLYGLYKAVLERGGLQSVIHNRAFKMVAKALFLPKTCTSAAFILRSEYEKLLYAYEQKHVFSRLLTDIPPIVQADRRKSLGIRSSPLRQSQDTPPPQPAAAVHPMQKAILRPKRLSTNSANTVPVTSTNPSLSAVADDPFAYPYVPRRTRLSSLDENSLDPREEQIVEDEIAIDDSPHPMYVPSHQAERDRIVAALQSPLFSDIAWSLGTLNALSFDLQNQFHVADYPGLLDVLHGVLYRHMEDVWRRRMYGVAAGSEELDSQAPRDSELSFLDVQFAGMQDSTAGVGVSGLRHHEDRLRSRSLQQYGDLFNVVDPIAIDREQCAVAATNVLRNMSFHDRNVIQLANASQLLSLTALMIDNMRVCANLRDGLMDMWINVSPYLDASPGRAGHAVLKTCVQLLHPFKEGANMIRFTNCCEVLARLSACPERNEKAITDLFDSLVPRVVDMLNGRHRKYLNAGLATLCNLSAFDWPARDQLARTPRVLHCLTKMLKDPEFAPRSALTLLNLAESPSNRSVLLVYERTLCEHAMEDSPVADIVASVLYELDND